MPSVSGHVAVLICPMLAVLARFAVIEITYISSGQSSPARYFVLSGGVARHDSMCCQDLKTAMVAVSLKNDTINYHA